MWGYTEPLEVDLLSRVTHFAKHSGQLIGLVRTILLSPAVSASEESGKQCAILCYITLCSLVIYLASYRCYTHD